MRTRDWRFNADDSLVCPHRDLSCCPDCALDPDVVEVYGIHYLDPDGSLRRELALEPVYAWLREEG